ncbi:hypothetical protein AB8E32_20560 [Marinomonas polaris]|uniref:hypothetical protein n=1 Tax=Marinomonas polaris TaxID=293552 RepID=UPI0035154F01
MIRLILKIIYNFYMNRFVSDFFGSKYSKRVLISYITKPFRINSKSHTNSYEVVSAAKIFHDLGYQVDIMFYENASPNLEKYDVIYGFGDVFKKYFESGFTDKITIYYGAGMHIAHQNTATLNRVKSVYEKKHVWLGKSSRFVEKNWSHQTTLVDAIIALGDQECKKTYRRYYEGPIYSLPAPFYKTLDAIKVANARNSESKKASYGLGALVLFTKG